MSDTEVKKDDVSSEVKDGSPAPEAEEQNLETKGPDATEGSSPPNGHDSAKTPSKKSTGRTPRGSKVTSKVEEEGANDYTPGDQVAVKIQGYPWWPAIVVTPEHFPAAALAARPHTKPRKDGTSVTTLPVQFLGAPEYYWSRPTDVKRLSKDEITSWLESGKKSASKGLKAAYQHAAESPTLDDLMQAKKNLEAQQANNDDEDEEMADEDENAVPEDDSDEIELDDEGKPIKKSKTKKKAAAAAAKTPKKTPAKTPTKKRKTEDDGSETPAKKSRATPKGSAKVKERSAPESPELTPEEAQKRAHEQKVKSVMFLRHKLQKCLLGKEEPEQKMLEEIPQYLDRLDAIEANVELFRETKIGKVLLRINKLEKIPRDETLGIKEHVGKLLEKWQEVMELQKKKDDEDATKTDGTEKVEKTEAANKDQPEAAKDSAKEPTTTTTTSTTDPASNGEKKSEATLVEAKSSE